jgi:acyl carrier protein
MGGPLPESRVSTQDRLAGYVLDQLRLLDREPEGGLTAGTSLGECGLLESLSLLHLALWIEAEIGAPLDVMAIDIAKEWDTVADIARFIETHRDT